MPTQRPRSAERGLFHNGDEGRLPLTVHRTVKTAATILGYPGRQGMPTQKPPTVVGGFFQIEKGNGLFCLK